MPSAWCLVRVRIGHGRKAKGVDQRRRRLGDRVVLDVDPAYAGVPAEPPLLAHRELAGAGDGRLHGSVDIRFVEQFLVAEGLASGTRQRPSCRQSLDLLGQAGRDHRQHPPLDACRQHLAAPAQSDHHDVGRRVGPETGTEGAERAAGTERHLQRPHDAPPVGWVDAPSGDRVERIESAPEGTDIVLGLQLLPNVRPLTRDVQLVDHGGEVEPGPGDEQRAT